jgi:hypothetical protein
MHPGRGLSAQRSAPRPVAIVQRQSRRVRKSGALAHPSGDGRSSRCGSADRVFCLPARHCGSLRNERLSMRARRDRRPVRTGRLCGPAARPASARDRCGHARLDRSASAAGPDRNTIAGRATCPKRIRPGSGRRLWRVGACKCRVAGRPAAPHADPDADAAAPPFAVRAMPQTRQGPIDGPCCLPVISVRRRTSP